MLEKQNQWDFYSISAHHALLRVEENQILDKYWVHVYLTCMYGTYLS